MSDLPLIHTCLHLKTIVSAKILREDIFGFVVGRGQLRWLCLYTLPIPLSTVNVCDEEVN